MQTIEVKILPLADVDLEGYGDKLRVAPGQAADSAGAGWQCWFPVHALDDAQGKHLGLVRTGAPRRVTEMEMHPRRAEMVLAIDKPVVQVLAKSSQDGQAPDPQTVRALYLAPGEALNVRPGIWHGVGLPYRDETIEYWFILAYPSAQDKAEELGWVGFEGGVQIVLKA